VALVDPAPLPPPPERELTLALPEGSQVANVRLLDAGIRSLAAQVERLRQRTTGQPAAFFMQWAEWRSQWGAFARRNTQESEQPMSADDRASLRRYVGQYESIRQGVLRSLGLAPSPSGESRWPWWVWAVLLGGAAAVRYALSRRSA